MAYDTFERSTETGQPVELYQLQISNTVYYMCSADVTVVALGQTWVPTEISRTKVTVSPQETADVLEIDMPASHPFPQRYITIVPGQTAVLTIFRFHKLDVTSETTVLYKGNVRSVAFSQDGTLSKLAVTPISTSLTRHIPRFAYQGICNHVLYDPRCKMIEGNFRVRNTCTAITGNGTILTVTGMNANPDQWAQGGYVTLNGTDFRLVTAHVGNNITIFLPFPADLPIQGSTLDVFAGCDHTITTCSSKFNNVINYGGYAFVPTLNPFNSGLK